MQNVKSNKMFYLNIRIYLQLGLWVLKTGFGLKLGPKDVPSFKSRTTFPIFINKASFHPESRGKSNKLLKY